MAMHSRTLSNILRVYARHDEYLRDSSLGKGLWPIDPVYGQLMHEVIRSRNLRYGVEVGAGIGYSTLWFGSAFKETGGKLISIEYFPPKVALLEVHVKRFGLEQVVHVVPSDFRRVRLAFGIDALFLDARKHEYLEALRLMLPKLKRGAYVFADNVLSHPHETQEYTRFVRNNRAFSSMFIPFGSGMEVSRYRA